MLKLREAGLYTSPAAKGKGSHFAGFVLGTHNQNDGVNWSRSCMFIQVATNPTATETIAIGAKTYTFVASGATGDQINIGLSASATATNIINKINADQASTFCTAYVCEDPTIVVLVDNRNWVTGQSGTAWTNDGAKVINITPWVQGLPESGTSGVEGSGYFKVALTDTGTVPVDPLHVHYYDGMGNDSGYSGTTPYQNFLY